MAEHRPDRADQPQAPRGGYIRTIDTANRDAECARLRSRSHTLAHIADAVGFKSQSSVKFAIERALVAAITEPAEELRRLELMKLDQLAVAAWAVLEARHYLVSQGRLIRIEDGASPLEDDGPVLNAIDRLLKISERRSKLLGLDAPIRAEVTTIDHLDAQIAALEADLAGRPPVDEDAAIEGPASS